MGRSDLNSKSSWIPSGFLWKNPQLYQIIIHTRSYRKNVKLALDPILHESYKNPKPESNDIALLKLAEDIDLNTYTPACLPTSGADYTGQNGRVYGGLSIIFKMKTNRKN